jgi:hypothetical protein
LRRTSPAAAINEQAGGEPSSRIEVAKDMAHPGDAA